MPEPVDQFREMTGLALAELRLTAAVVVESVRLSPDGTFVWIYVKRPDRESRLVTASIEGVSDVELRRKVREELRKQLQMCPLCSGLSDDIRPHHDENGNLRAAYDVDCSKCRRFVISDILFGELRRAVDSGDLRTLELLPFLSAHTSAATTPPVLTTDSWEALAGEEKWKVREND